MKMLGYRERPPAEWTPLFWSILRSRIVDLQRRRTFRLRWLRRRRRTATTTDAIDWADDAPDPVAPATTVARPTRASPTALSALPRRQREAFTLRVLEELDVGDDRARHGLQRRFGQDTSVARTRSVAARNWRNSDERTADPQETRMTQRSRARARRRASTAHCARACATPSQRVAAHPRAVAAAPARAATPSGARVRGIAGVAPGRWRCSLGLQWRRSACARARRRPPRRAARPAKPRRRRPDRRRSTKTPISISGSHPTMRRSSLRSKP